MDGYQLGANAMMAAFVAKTVVDAVKISAQPPGWVLPIMAILIGCVVSTIQLAASGAPLVIATVAEATLNGIVAGVAAVGSTELQKRAASPPISSVSQSR